MLLLNVTSTSSETYLSPKLLQVYKQGWSFPWDFILIELSTMSREVYPDHRERDPKGTRK